MRRRRKTITSPPHCLQGNVLDKKPCVCVRKKDKERRNARTQISGLCCKSRWWNWTAAAKLAATDDKFSLCQTQLTSQSLWSSVGEVGLGLSRSEEQLWLVGSEWETVFPPQWLSLFLKWETGKRARREGKRTSLTWLVGWVSLLTAQTSPSPYSDLADQKGRTFQTEGQFFL